MDVWGEGLHTSLEGNTLTTSNFGNEQDLELVSEIIAVISKKQLSIGKAMAVLDTARTAMLRKALEWNTGSFGIGD